MSLDTQEKLNKSEQDYDDKFKNIADNYHKDADGSSEQKSIDSARQKLANSEQQSGQDGKKALGDTAAGKAALATAGTAAGPVGRIATTLIGKLRTKQGGAGAAIAAVLLLIGGVGFFSTFLAPIAFVENVFDDLNDQLAALDIRQEGMMRAKVSYNERDKAFKGCTKLSIRCKAKSLSTTQMKNFNEAGIKVNGRTISFGGVSRTFPDSYDFNGQNYKPAEFVNAMKTNNALRLSFKRAVNMKFRGFTDNRFINWTQKKLGFSKKKASLVGSEEERAKQFATLERTRVTPDTQFVKITNAEGKEVWVIAGGDPNIQFTEEEYQRFKAQFDSLLKSSSSLGKLSTQTLKALSALGWYDMACSVKNMIGISATTARVLNQYSLAQYAGPIWSTVHAMKASDISSEDAVAVQKYFLDTDARQTAPDLKKTFEEAGVSEGDELEDVPDVNQIATSANPYYGKNVMDSPLYKLSTYGSDPMMSQGSTRYGLGFGASTLLSAVGATAAIANEILNIGAGDSDRVCSIVQNWAVRGISFVVGAIAAIFSGGTSVAVNLAIMAVIGAAFFAASTALLSAMTNDIIPEDIDQLPEEKAAALWTGTAVINGESARSSGMMPGSAEEITKYQQYQAASIRDYVAIEAQDASPFDVTNPHSTAGKSILALQQFKPESYTASGLVAAVTSMQNHALAQAFTTSASAADDKMERFKKCDDSAYEDLGIDADVQCNIRYIMSDTDLNRATEDVIDYMETKGYVELDKEVQESVTGLPEGYTPPNPSETSSVMTQIVSGVTSQFFNSRSYGTTDAGQRYGKFLDYCIYRAMPYGITYEESGMWGSAEKEWQTGELCMSDTEEISMFRAYTMDVRIVDIAEPVDFTSDTPTSGTGTGSGSGTVSGDVRSLAQQILDLEKAGKITIAILRQEDVATRTAPKQQLEDIAAGKPPAAPTRCSFSVATPINPDPKLLQFLVNFGGQYKYQITSLFGQCHSSNSDHYKGKAVDFGCPLNTTIGDRVGAPLNVGRNDETCANDAHWHYRVSG